MRKTCAQRSSSLVGVTRASHGFKPRGQSPIGADDKVAAQQTPKKPFAAWQQIFTPVVTDSSYPQQQIGLSPLAAATMSMAEDVALGEDTLKRKANQVIDSRRARHDLPAVDTELATLRTERLFPIVPRLEGLQFHFTDTRYTQHLMVRIGEELSKADEYLHTLLAGGDGVPESVRKARIEVLISKHKVTSDQLLREAGQWATDLLVVPLALDPLPQSDLNLLLQTLCRNRGLVYEPMASDPTPTLTSIQRFISSGSCPPASIADVADIYDQGAAFTSNGWVLVVHTENIPTNTVVEMFSARLGIPNTAIRSMVPTSKQSSGLTTLYILPNHVRREHLLLLNVMTYPGYVLKVGNITAIPDELFADSQTLSKIDKFVKLAEKHERAFQVSDLLANDAPHKQVVRSTFPHASSFVTITKLFRRIQGGSKSDIEQSLQWLKKAGAINYHRVPAANILSCGKALLSDDIKKGYLSILYDRASPKLLKNFLVMPTVANAVAAKSARLLPEPDTMLKNFILTSGDYAECLGRVSKVTRKRISYSIETFIYNGQISARLRLSNSKVLVGDFVVKRASNDADEEGSTVAENSCFSHFSNEQVHLIASEEEADQHSISDVVIPFRTVRPSDMTREPSFVDSFAPSGSPCAVNTKEWLMHFLAMHGIPAAFATNTLCEAAQKALGVFGYSHEGKHPSAVSYRLMIATPFKLTYDIYEDPIRWEVSKADRHPEPSAQNETDASIVEATANEEDAFTSEGFSLLDEAPLPAYEASSASSSTSRPTAASDISLLQLRGTPLISHQQLYEEVEGQMPMGIRTWAAGHSFFAADNFRLLASAKQQEELARCGVPDGGPLGPETVADGSLLPTAELFGLPSESLSRDEVPEAADQLGETKAKSDDGGKFMVWGSAKRRSEAFVSAKPLTDSKKLSDTSKDFTLKITFTKPSGAGSPEILLDSYLSRAPIANAVENASQHSTGNVAKVANASLLRVVATTTTNDALFDRIANELYSRVTIVKPATGDGKQARVTVRQPSHLSKDQLRQTMLTDLKTWRLDESQAPTGYSTLARKTACDICFMADHTSSEHCANFKYHKLRRQERKREGHLNPFRQRSAQITNDRKTQTAELKLQANIARQQQLPKGSSTESPKPALQKGPLVAEWSIVIDRNDESTPWGFFASGVNLSRITLPDSGSGRTFTITKTKNSKAANDADCHQELEKEALSVSADMLSSALSAEGDDRVFVVSEVNGMEVSSPSALVSAVRNNIKVLDYESDPDTRLRLTVAEHKMVPIERFHEESKTAIEPQPSPVTKLDKDSAKRYPSAASTSTKVTESNSSRGLLPTDLTERYYMNQASTTVNFIRRSKSDRWGLNAQGLRLMPASAPTAGSGVAAASSRNQVLTEVLLSDVATAGGSHLFEAPSHGPGSVKRVTPAQVDSSPDVLTDTVFVVRAINHVRIVHSDDMHRFMTAVGRDALRLSIVCEQVSLPMIQVELGSTNATQSPSSSSSSEQQIGFSISSKGRLAALTVDHSMFGEALLKQAPVWCNLRPDFANNLKSYDSETPEELLDDDENDSAAAVLKTRLLYDKKALETARWRLEAVNGVDNFNMRSLKSEMEQLKSGSGVVKLSLRMVVPVGEV